PLGQKKPGLRALIEHDLAVDVPAVAEHQHEHPRLALGARYRIPAITGVTKVDLRHLARLRDHRDGDVLGPDAALATDARDHPLDPTELARKRRVLQPQPVPDRLRPEAKI